MQEIKFIKDRECQRKGTSKIVPNHVAENLIAKGYAEPVAKEQPKKKAPAKAKAPEKKG